MRIEIRGLLLNTRVLGVIILLMSLIPVMPNAVQAQNSEEYKRSTVHAMTFTQLQDRFYKTEIKKEISVDVHQMTLEQALRVIARETGLRLSYRGDIMVDKMISIQNDNITVSDALATVLANTGLDYKISQDGYLMIIEKEVMPVVIFQETVTGRVVDAQTGEALPGVNVIVLGSEEATGSIIGTTTNNSGIYEVEVPEGMNTLVFTFVGYQRLEVAIDGRNEIDVQLSSDDQLLDDVIVVGYGTQRRSELTGSISSISSREITEQPVYNVEQALQGLAAGVRVEADGFRPGEGATIRVRGMRSFVASNDPLMVVDGIPIEGGLSDINTRNIESIEILKDASATAIYGSRGANGVVLITTQRGFEGRTSVQYSGFAGLQRVANTPEFMNGERYAEMKRQAHMHQGTYTGNDEDILEVFELNALEQGISTNWPDLIWQDGFQQDHQLTITGGDERTRYYLSGGFSDHLGIAPNNDFARYSGQINIDHNVADWMRIDLTSQITRSLRHQAGSMSNTYNINPLATPYDDEGNLVFYPAVDVFQENPLFDYDRDNYEDRRERTRIIGSLRANFNILENLTYRLTFAPDWTFRNEGRFRGSNSTARDQGTSDARVRNENISNYLFDNLIEYIQPLADRHTLNATLLYSVQTFKSDYRSIEVEDLPYEHQRFYNIGTAAQENSRSSFLTEWALESYMARLNYNFDDRYLLTVTGRVDGSSRMAEGNKYGLFPSAALAWNVSNETFFQNQQLFDYLRLRLSYGLSGNTAISPYQTQGGIGLVPYSFANQPVFGFANENIANPDLRWESTEQVNMGVEFSVLDSRINADINLYRSETRDLLMNRALPSTSGYSSVVENIGSTRNTGFEINLSTENVRMDRFQWNTNLNFSTNQNQITELYGGQQDDPGNQWFIGQPIIVHYDWQFDGIWQLGEEEEAAQFDARPGDIKIADINNDGRLTDQDRVILGSPFPEWEVGMTNRFFFGNFNLSTQIYMVQGVMLQSGAYGDSQVPLRARYNSRDVDFWTPENPSNEWPRPRFERHHPELVTRSYVSGDYIRVRNITVGYNLPNSVTQNLGILSARVYATSQNPFTITDFEGADPEAATGHSFPNARTFLIGVDLMF